ncbi:MAG: AraC family transcriptional regulator [Roseburia sp.]|nr:AraC family transcriptional regulator [Roseburia sp.]
MFEWNEAVQNMINWMEEHLTENPSLLEMSAQIGYSPYYCSNRFHEITGMTLRSYLAGRRLARATLEIRDTDERIIDIAVKYGYSSQEALTRAFVSAYGCTPAAYRKRPVPIALSNLKVVFFPEHYINKGGPTMNKTLLTDAHIRVEHIPAHRYIGIWDITATDYMSFWSKHDCEKVCGIIDSMSHVSHPIVTCHTAGWFYENGRKGYFYGFGVPDDYDGDIPDGFAQRSVPASDYLVFFHPPFDYLKDCGEVMGRVERLAWGYDPKENGYVWNEEICPDYQRHFPEVIGYEVLRPVKRV